MKNTKPADTIRLPIAIRIISRHHARLVSDSIIDSLSFITLIFDSVLLVVVFLVFLTKTHSAYHFCGVKIVFFLEKITLLSSDVSKSPDRWAMDERSLLFSRLINISNSILRYAYVILQEYGFCNFDI